MKPAITAPFYTPRGHRQSQDTHRSTGKSTHSRRGSHCTELRPATTGLAQYRVDLLQCLTSLFAAESHKPTVSGSSMSSAGAETRRVSPSDTMNVNTHNRSTEMFETGEERLRPTDVQHSRTWERAIESLKRQISQGKTATSNTSRVEPFLPNYRHSVLFSLMSSFRDVGCYPGRIGRKGSALRNQEVERVGARILRPGALDVNRTRLDVTRRCHR